MTKYSFTVSSAFLIDNTILQGKHEKKLKALLINTIHVISLEYGC